MKSPLPRFVQLLSLIGLLGLLGITAHAEAGSRTFSGAGDNGSHGYSLTDRWVRPAVGTQPAASAFWESTAFYVTESGSYSFDHRVRDIGVETEFPRALFLYSHAFDPQAPQRNLVASIDLSDGRALAQVDWSLVANNMYLFVLSTIDEMFPFPESDGPDQPHVLRVSTTISGPGEIGYNYCRFSDDVENDADGMLWNYGAAMAPNAFSAKVSTVCHRWWKGRRAV